MQAPVDDEEYGDRLNSFLAKNSEVEQETNAARELINEIIADRTTPSDYAGLARIETRIRVARTDLHRELAAEAGKLIESLDSINFAKGPRNPRQYRYLAGQL